MESFTKYVVVGGGIAGVTCVESLAILAPEDSVTLISASTLIKNVSNVAFYGKTIIKFDVQETEATALKRIHSNLNIVYDKLTFINTTEHYILTCGKVKIKYEYLCICTGGTPKLIPQKQNSDRILGIRDTDSCKKFQEKLRNSKKMVVVGNGGIASEIIYATEGIDTTWVIKDNHITSTFIDPGAAQFFQDALKSGETKDKKTLLKRQVFSEETKTDISINENVTSAALGPDWCQNFNHSDNIKDSKLEIVYNAEILAVSENIGEWPLTVHLNNGNNLFCDFVISATGVYPALNFECDVPLKKGPDGGIAVDEFMKTSASQVYAAGDIAYAAWLHSPQWFQMRLWTQARQMGSMAAKAMYAKNTDEEIMQDFCFELFTHTTKLYGYQVVLLGKYNGQGLGSNYEILIRTTPNVEYIKFVLVDNRLQGVILIGETGLEEMCENLILNQLDLSPFGDDILNPDIDIDDYFD